MTSKLKINKSDGLTGSSSDHFVYAPHRFAVLFTMLINVMFVHGYMPDDMVASVLVSIPKDHRASLTNSGNYRAIALYSSMGKIVDMLISDIWAAVFTCNPYLLISINELLISINELLISINELLISINELLISIIHLLISIKMVASVIIIDINK